jgi:aldehyde dehydrogenase (NAD+)
MEREEVAGIIERQRDFFATGETREISFRIKQLKTLKRMLEGSTKPILKALKDDMSKPGFEAYVAEISHVQSEIDYAIGRIKSWAKRERVKTPSFLFIASSHIYHEPLGVVLIIGPWNYPLDLVLVPLVGAISAGNCAVLKPSELTSYTSTLIAKMIGENFDPSFVTVVEGGAEETQALLSEKFDYIFYTGGSVVGKLIMEAASKNLTPVTLELGGKSPCIVEADIDLDKTARRITWGKFFNAGQTCIAPDYLLVNKSIKKALVERIGQCIREFYGDDPSKSPDYARIVNDRHFNRLSNLLRGGDIVVGGQTDPATRYIAPTVVENVSSDDPIMLEEVFGPILPVIEYEVLGDAISSVRSREKPLALFFFSKNKADQKRVLRETTSGGGCINDTMVQYSNILLPFGGVGVSGFGKYHGKASFDTFSNKRSIVDRSFLFDVYLRYPPYKNALKLAQRFIRYVT